MRGANTFTEGLFTLKKLDDFVPANHPLRVIGLAGAGMVTASGRVDVAQLRLPGTGSIDTVALHAGHADIQLKGVGDVDAWKGTLQQYAGRLHRGHAGKTGVRVLDYVDGGHPVLLRMWEKRQRGYRAMGYQMCMPGQEFQLTLT